MTCVMLVIIAIVMQYLFALKRNVTVKLESQLPVCGPFAGVIIYNSAAFTNIVIILLVCLTITLQCFQQMDHLKLLSIPSVFKSQGFPTLYFGKRNPLIRFDKLRKRLRATRRKKK